MVPLNLIRVLVHHPEKESSSNDMFSKNSVLKVLIYVFKFEGPEVGSKTVECAQTQATSGRSVHNLSLTSG